MFISTFLRFISALSWGVSSTSVGAEDDGWEVGHQYISLSSSKILRQTSCKGDHQVCESEAILISPELLAAAKLS